MSDAVFDDVINQLPYELQQDSQWAEKRNAILDSLRNDAKGLPMNTSQNLLMERMATFYVVMRKRETDPESLNMKVADVRQNQQQWLAMTTEFNKQLTVGEDKRRSAMIDTILGIVTNAINTIQDPRIKEDLRKRLAEDFKEAGL